MEVPGIVITHDIGNITIHVAAPDPDSIRNNYNNHPDQPFPFWSRIWPSAIAMASFLNAHRDHLTNKTIVELGAGLGLPSLLAARYAVRVLTTDYLSQPFRYINESATLNRLTNIQTSLCDWHKDELPTADVVLMSDINYSPGDLPGLRIIIRHCINRGITVFLSTPDRLISREFLSSIQPDIHHSEIIQVEGQACSVVLLTGPGK